MHYLWSIRYHQNNRMPCYKRSSGVLQRSYGVIEEIILCVATHHMIWCRDLWCVAKEHTKSWKKNMGSFKSFLWSFKRLFWVLQVFKWNRLEVLETQRHRDTETVTETHKYKNHTDMKTHWYAGTHAHRQCSQFGLVVLYYPLDYMYQYSAILSCMLAKAKPQ